MIGRVDFKAGERDCVIVLDHAALYQLESQHGLTPNELAIRLSSPVVLHKIFLVGMDRANKRFKLGLESVDDEYVYDVLGDVPLQEAIKLADRALTLSLLGKEPEQARDEAAKEDPKA